MIIRRAGGLIEHELTGTIISAFHEVYNTLGYGHAERTYMNALEYELVGRRCLVGREIAVRVFYKEFRVGWHRVGMLVNEKVVVEVKATEVLPSYAQRQLQNYLRATRIEVGMLLHFGPRPKYHRLYSPRF